MDVETIAPPYPPIDQTDPRLLYILRNLIAQTASDMGCVYVRNVDTNTPEITAVYPAEVTPMPDWVMMMQWLRDRLERIRTGSLYAGNGPQFYSLDETMGFSGAVLWAFLIPPDLAGGIVLFFRERSVTFTSESAPDTAVLIEMAQTTLENQHLVEKLLTTEAMAYTAQAIAKDPSPQSIVHVMRDHLFDAHVSSGTILLYGPTDVERPSGPFDYLEIVASWSRELGSGLLIGQQFPLAPFEPWLKSLERDKLLSIIDLKDFLATLGTFGLTVIDELQAQSITILPLQSSLRRLGLLVLTTDKAHEFSPFELRAFQIICEFLTMTTITEIVQKQSNYIQQIRAALLDAVTNGVLMVRPDKNATILTINKQFTEMFGFKEDEAQDASLWTLFDSIRVAPNVRRDLLKNWQESGPTQRDEGEFKLVNTRGIASDIEWYSAPVYQEKEFIGRIYTFHDVTTKRSAERLRSELLARVSHELRTPLTSISGFAQFILNSKD
ncbi:MAG: PAS domain-containing protein, partial [Burkholderiales bacterium]|nr:PAS domain-containing protein [Anaerolineae bacterium]